MEHTQQCLEQTRRFLEEEEKWMEKHPKYCKNCQGWGVFYSTYDPSPAGVSLSSGSMVDAEPCSECVEKGWCPHCSGALELDSNDEFSTCTECGWTDKDEDKLDGLPEPPECFCWEEEINKGEVEDLLS